MRKITVLTWNNDLEVTDTENCNVSYDGHILTVISDNDAFNFTVDCRDKTAENDYTFTFSFTSESNNAFIQPGMLSEWLAIENDHLEYLPW